MGVVVEVLGEDINLSNGGATFLRLGIPESKTRECIEWLKANPAVRVPSDSHANGLLAAQVLRSFEDYEYVSANDVLRAWYAIRFG